MRSAFVLGVNLDAIRYEVGDISYSAARNGLSAEERDKLTKAMECLSAAAAALKSFRFVKGVEDLPAAVPPSKSKK